MEESISLQELFATLKKRLGLIAVLTILTIIIAGVVSYKMLTPIYESSTQILVNQEKTDAAQLLKQNIETDLQLINTYRVIIKSPAILEPVSEGLDLGLSMDELTKKIAVTNAEHSQVVNVTVQDPDPERAVVIANTTANVFQERIQELMNVDNVSILSPAVLEESPKPITPNPMTNMAIAAVVGLMIGIGIAFLMDYLDTTLKNDRDIEEVLGIPLLGVISPIKEKDSFYTASENSSKRRLGERGS